MKTGNLFNRWSIAVALLVIIIIAGGVVIGLKSSQDQPIEISLDLAPAPAGDIYITGEVNNPGIYPLKPGDTLEDILRAAGGATDDADLSRVELSIPEKGEVAELQKVNINTADAWLLAALPGIGEGRAQAIIAYRQQNGPFRDINELLNVENIGSITLDNIRDLITVAD
jgi:competence protein ComEA